MLASHLCLGLVTGFFPLDFLTIHSVSEDPTIPLSLILSPEINLVRGSSHEVTQYAVFFSLLLLPPSQAQYIFQHPVLSSKASVFFSVRDNVSHIRNCSRIIVHSTINYVFMQQMGKHACQDLRWQAFPQLNLP